MFQPVANALYIAASLLTPVTIVGGNDAPQYENRPKDGRDRVKNR